MPHQYQATIDLIKTVIHRLPGVFPQGRHQEMENAIATLERNSDATLEGIESMLVAFGMELWPYCEAYEQFYKIYGEAKERELMRQKLSEPARAAFDKFVAEGGNIESVRDGSRFEHFFDSDIRSEVVAAELDAHDGVHEEMERLIAGDRAAEFEALLADYRQKQAALNQKINELAALAERSPDQRAEILDKVKTFREGFAYVERMSSLDDIAHEIQYYIDIMEV
jgi:hypothetical protein